MMSADPCESARIFYENACEEVEKFIKSPSYSRSKCEILTDHASAKLEAYIWCLRRYARPWPRHIMPIPSCPPERAKPPPELPPELPPEPPAAAPGKTMIVRLFPNLHTLHHHLGVLRNRVFTAEMHRKLHPLI